MVESVVSNPPRVTHELTGANVSSGGEGVRLGHDLRLSRRWAASATNTDPAVGGGFSGGQGLDVEGAFSQVGEPPGGCVSQEVLF
ncbi:hypothetical protein TIFTF001_018502 [Ficus carica]|uniref:Uncharacterized protein n=1 Tax=Ficus carica TaxID=3494 RepID=A0AA88ABI7_FICCA|nr:hypothetical protein TIFTF001_018502 [Ficus carica]